MRARLPKITKEENEMLEQMPLEPTGESIPVDCLVRLKAIITKNLKTFTEKPLGTIESDLCDWNKPSAFAYNYSPEELQDKVIKRIEEIFDYLIEQQKQEA